MRPTIVAAVNERFYGNLRNLIGSVHKFEPELPIIVYDLGLTDSSVRELQSMCKVKVIKFPFDKYPTYVQDLGQFGWKPILVKDVIDNHAECILYLDSSVELRQPITSIKEALSKDGYWFSTTEWHFPNRFSHSQVFQYFKLKPEDFNGEDWEAAATFAGFKRNSPAYNEILIKWEKCALQIECLAPSETNRANHRQDQTALNFIIYGLAGFRDKQKAKGSDFNIHLEWSYFAWKENGLPPDPKYHIPIILFTRRGGGGSYYQNICKSGNSCCEI